MKKIKTDIPFNYITVKTTKSRIDKGLLAIPSSLIHVFPKNNSKIVIINESGNEEIKNFTAYLAVYAAVFEYICKMILKKRGHRPQ